MEIKSAGSGSGCRPIFYYYASTRYIEIINGRRYCKSDIFYGISVLPILSYPVHCQKYRPMFKSRSNLAEWRESACVEDASAVSYSSSATPVFLAYHARDGFI